MSKPIVITGAQGFIGRELRKVCQRAGRRVVGIDILPSSEPDDIQCDITSPELIDAIPADCEEVVHLAALSRYSDCTANPPLAMQVNVGGTANVAEVCKVRKVKHLVFASSEWVYGEVSDHGVQHEQDPIDIDSIDSEYALSKILAEKYLRLAETRGLCPVTVLRFAIVYGPRAKDWSAVEALFNLVRTAEEVTVGSLGTARRFIHVSDIANGIFKVLPRRESGLFNLSGDKLITLEDVISMSKAITNKNPTVRQSEPDNKIVRNPDNTRFKKEMQWSPACDLTEGLKTVYDFLSRHQSHRNQ